MATNYQMTPEELKTFNSLPGTEKGSYATGLANKATPTQTDFKLPSLSGTQQSATNWINNSASGQGGIDKYIADQVGRYTTAVQSGETGLADRLVADSNRVGFTLPKVLNPMEQNITDTANNDLAQKKLGIQQSVDAANQSRALGLTQNQNLLNESLTRLGQSQAVQNQAAQELQNRRGGFYSGGLDHQLGGIASSINEQRGGLERDFGARNAGIIGQNTLASSQAAEQIAQLQAAQPAEIQSRIANALAAKQAAQDKAAQQSFDNDTKLSGITGYWNNSAQTSAVQDQMDRNSAAYASASPDEQKRLHDENVRLAASIGGQDVTGSGDYAFGPGSPTLAREKQEYDIASKDYERAYTEARDNIKDAQWQAKFDQDVYQQGLDFALDQAYKGGQLSIQQKNAATSAAREARLAKGDSGGGEKISTADFNDTVKTLEQKYGVADYGSPIGKDKYGAPIFDTTKEVRYKPTTNRDQQVNLVHDVLNLELNDDQTTQLLNKLGLTMDQALSLLGE